MQPKTQDQRNHLLPFFQDKKSIWIFAWHCLNCLTFTKSCLWFVDLVQSFLHDENDVNLFTRSSLNHKYSIRLRIMYYERRYLQYIRRHRNISQQQQQQQQQPQCHHKCNYINRNRPNTDMYKSKSRTRILSSKKQHRARHWRKNNNQ